MDKMKVVAGGLIMIDQIYGGKEYEKNKIP